MIPALAHLLLAIPNVVVTASGDNALYLHAFARQRVLVIATIAISIISVVHAKSLANMVCLNGGVSSCTHTHHSRRGALALGVLRKVAQGVTTSLH